MIGIFDSGVGGMTVAKAIEQRLSGSQLVYFGDLARTPYGSKSAQTIAGYARQNTEFLLAAGAAVIVVACNSAASVASDMLINEFPIPVFEVISPAVIMAVSATRNGRIGVIGTRATIRSGVYEKKIKEADPACRVFSQACPLLVPLVEEGWMHKRETKMILRSYLAELKQQQIDTLVLGCTHYPLLKDLIQHRIGNRVAVIDSSEAVAGAVHDFVADHPDVANRMTTVGGNMFYVSDVTEAAALTAKRIFGRNIDLRLARTPEL
jgi:glutamate racemase